MKKKNEETENKWCTMNSNQEKKRKKTGKEKETFYRRDNFGEICKGTRNHE